MHDLLLTRHAETRMQQRGFQSKDISLVLNVATRIADDAFFLSDQDTTRAIEQRRREIQQLERLRGAKLIVDGERLITLYRSKGKSARVAVKHRRKRS